MHKEKKNVLVSVVAVLFCIGAISTSSFIIGAEYGTSRLQEKRAQVEKCVTGWSQTMDYLKTCLQKHPGCHAETD